MWQCAIITDNTALSHNFDQSDIDWCIVEGCREINNRRYCKKWVYGLIIEF